MLVCMWMPSHTSTHIHTDADISVYERVTSTMQIRQHLPQAVGMQEAAVSMT